MPEESEQRALGDEQLMTRSAALDPNAFAELYDRHAGQAIALATRMVGGDRAALAVRDAFEGIWRNAAHFDPGRGTVRSWLLETVRRRCLDELRQLDANERTRIRGQGEAAPIPHSEQESTAGRSAVASLTDDERRVIDLAFFGGLTRAEIAAHLQMTEASVNDLIAAAFQRMTKRLESEAPNGT